MKTTNLLFAAIALFLFQACDEPFTAVISEVPKERTLGALAETGEILAIVDADVKTIFIDENYQEEFLTTFPSTITDNLHYFKDFDSDIGYGFRELSAADYDKEVTKQAVWMSSRECQWIENAACMNTVGYPRAKSFKMNGPSYLCVIVNNKDSKCLLNYLRPLVREFYPEKNCKGTPSYYRRDDVKVPVCSGAS